MLSKEEVLKIAKLARLSLSDEEVTFYQKHLTRVLEYMKDLEKVGGTQPGMVRHIPLDAEPFHEDSPQVFQNRSALLKGAPESEEDCFLLPTVVEFSE